jgi:hypothetical protein
VGVCGLNACGPGQASVSGSCENSNEPSSFIKCGNFLIRRVPITVSKVLCLMELVTLPVARAMTNRIDQWYSTFPPPPRTPRDTFPLNFVPPKLLVHNSSYT